MGMGNRKRKGGRLNRRRTRRIGPSEGAPHSGIRRKRRSSAGIFSCCCGALSDPIERNQDDISALQKAQKQMLASFKLQATEVNFDQENPVWHASHDQDRQDEVDSLQKEQLDLFKDIVLQQNNESDPDVTQELYKQQCELIEQMRDLQRAGYAYPDGIPSPVKAADQNEAKNAEGVENANVT